MDDIVVLKCQRNKLHLDGYIVEVVDINKHIATKYQLREGVILSLKTYLEIVKDASLSKGIFLLSKRDYSKSKIYDKLILKFRSQDVVRETISQVVNYFEEKNYIDDLEYVKSYIRTKKDRSRRRLEYDLAREGISKDIVDEALKEEDQGDIPKILIYLKKLVKRERDKKIRYLMGKGFSYGDILDALKIFDEDL